MVPKRSIVASTQATASSTLPTWAGEDLGFAADLGGRSLQTVELSTGQHHLRTGIGERLGDALADTP